MQLTKKLTSCWQQCRTRLPRCGSAALLALIVCSAGYGQQVRVNYMPNTDFSKYRTYRWAPTGGLGQPDQILDAQIKQSIDSQLVGKGFTSVLGSRLFRRVKVPLVLE